jgi:hypothetical protein
LFLDFGLGMNGDFFFFFLFKKYVREMGAVVVRNRGGGLGGVWRGPFFSPIFLWRYSVT